MDKIFRCCVCVVLLCVISFTGCGRTSETTNDITESTDENNGAFEFAGETVQEVGSEVPPETRSLTVFAF